MLKQLFFIIILISLLSFSCKKKTNPLILFFSPNTLSYNKHPNDVLKLEVIGSSDNNLTKFIIKTCKENDYSTTILDTNITGDKISYTLEYQLPYYTDTTRIILEFILYDNSGDKTTAAISVTLFPQDILLTETSGHEMFSHSSVKYDAYNLSTGLPLHSETADSAVMHIADFTSDTLTPNTLSRKWVSYAGNKFVRFTDFNYPNATFQILKNSYNAGIKNNFMDNIQEGDIILTKIGNQAIDSGYVAIKVLMVIDQDSSDFDRYIFSIKK